MMKITMITVSPSQIGTLLECPRCLWLYFRNGLKRPSGPFPSLPGGFDALFKNYFDEFRRAGKFPPELDGITDGVLFGDSDTLNGWRNNRKGISAEFPEMKILLKGAIDDLLVNSKGEFVPIDFKTRGYPVKEDTPMHYRTQLDLYALLFKNNGHNVSSYGYLLFFWPKKYANKKAGFETEVVKMDVNPGRGLGVLRDVADIVNGAVPGAQSTCEFCRFREFPGMD